MSEEDIVKMKVVVESITRVLENAMKEDFSEYEYEILLYGSTINGLSVKGSSDLDITLIIKNDPLPDHLIALSLIEKQLK